MKTEPQTAEQMARPCPCCEMWGPLPFVIGGPCRACGHTHPGRGCEEFKAEQDRVVQRIVAAVTATLSKPKELSMSYSFNVQAPIKAEAEIKVRDELVKVVSAQPVHKHDCDQAFNAAEAFIRLLPDDAGKDISVGVSGSLSWELRDGKEYFTGASVNVNASLRQRNG